MANLPIIPNTFQELVLTWFDKHGRKNLPWQQNVTPYRVWLSETMLQQTQVATVIPYFNAFIAKFPNIESLADAPLDEVLPLWSGLGYYARARNLHKTARLIVQRGYFPNTLTELIALPGIGLSTAGAILSIAFHHSQPILDGNVKRVLARFNAIAGWTGSSLVAKQLWTIATALTPQQRVADYTQAMMDLGATVCTRKQPLCITCPLQQHCLAKNTNTIALYPTPKATKTLPVKSVVFLLLRNNAQQIFLMRRPPVGIWGGLWSLPEFENESMARQWCYDQNLPIFKEQLLITQRHSFSHYHLDYTPLLVQTSSPNNIVMEANDMLWYNAKQLDKIGLATPIKRLLQQQIENNHD